MFGKNKESKDLDFSVREKKERVEAKKKADYIIEKSKLSEKELLAEILYRLENIDQNTEDIYDVLYTTGTTSKFY
jgi:hypothetical protein